MIGSFSLAMTSCMKASRTMKVGGRRIFVQQENFASGFHSFYDAGRLGGASTGVFCGKTTSVFLIRKIIDEEGDIYIFDKASVFGAKFQRGIVGDDIFAAVTGNMVVDTKFQGIQKRGFAVVAAAYDQGDPLVGSPCRRCLPLCGSFMVTRRDSGEVKGMEPFIGREEMPLSRGRMEPSATKATRFLL